jgi:hypothetical protein
MPAYKCLLNLASLTRTEGSKSGTLDGIEFSLLEGTT